MLRWRSSLYLLTFVKAVAQKAIDFASSAERVEHYLSLSTSSNRIHDSGTSSMDVFDFDDEKKEVLLEFVRAVRDMNLQFGK